MSISDLLSATLSSALLSAIVSSAISNILAYRRMRYERNEEKALEVYDECLSTLGEFRCKPSLVLDDEYIIRLMGLSPKLKAYGKQEVYDAISNFFEFANEQYKSWQETKSQLEDCYWREESHLDSSGEIDTSYYCADPTRFNEEYALRREQHTPSFTEAKGQVDNVSNAISESLKVQFSSRRF